MTPIENPNIIEPSERDKKMQSEIEQFLSADCLYAEMWKDDTVASQRNVQLYYRNLRRMRLTTRIEFNVRKGKVIAHRKDGTG